MGAASDQEKPFCDKLIGLLEKGGIPWRVPWRDGDFGKQHLNLISGHRYGGTDVILLEVARVARDAPLPFWCTYMEAKHVGLTPRRGSQGVHLGWADACKASCRQNQIVVFNVIDLVGAPLQKLLARRQRNSRELARTRQGCETSLADRARSLILPTEGASRLAAIEDPWATAKDKPPAEFLWELTWTLLADQMNVRRECGGFLLAEADWIQMLEQSPQAFFDSLAWASKAVNALAPATQSQGDVLTNPGFWCGSPHLDSAISLGRAESSRFTPRC
jgi:antirestriction protein ArdC